MELVPEDWERVHLIERIYLRNIDEEEELMWEDVKGVNNAKEKKDYIEGEPSEVQGALTKQLQP